MMWRFLGKVVDFLAGHDETDGLRREIASLRCRVDGLEAQARRGQTVTGRAQVRPFAFDHVANVHPLFRD